MTTRITFRSAASAALCALLLATLVAAPSAQISNPGFETGDFSGWIVDDMAVPYVAMQVAPAGWGDPQMPSEGDWCLVNGFDGGGPDSIVLAQDVGIPKTAATLFFDYAANWDMNGYGGTLDRQFSLLVEEAGGGAVLRELAVRKARAGSHQSTGLVTASADVSDFRGDTVRLKFVWSIPEDHTGPAYAQLDNLRLLGKQCEPVERGSLKLRMCFDQIGVDSARLQLVVPVQPGFVPTGHVLVLHIGDLQRTVVLDSKGRGSGGDVAVRVRPEPQAPGFQRVRAVLKKGNFLTALQPYGLNNITTAKGGETRDLPVRIELDGLTTEVVECVEYTAKQFWHGVAKVVHTPARTPTRLGVWLDFDDPDRDRLVLKSMASTHAGFLPEARMLSVLVGSVERKFVFDAQGRAVTPTDKVTLRRDNRVHTQQSFKWSCKRSDLSTLTAWDGFVDTGVPKPGLMLQPEILISVDGLVCQPLLELTYLAKAGKSGKATGKL